MANKIVLKVEITMSHDIPKDQEANITENVIAGLADHVENSEQGIAGDDFEGYTTKIMVESDSLAQEWTVKGGIETI